MESVKNENSHKISKIGLSNSILYILKLASELFLKLRRTDILFSKCYMILRRRGEKELCITLISTVSVHDQTTTCTLPIHMCIGKNDKKRSIYLNIHGFTPAERS